MIETVGYSVSAEHTIPHILRRADDIERIIALVISQAECTRELLGTGIPRRVHQLVLMNRLLRMGLSIDVDATLCDIDDGAAQSRSVIAVSGRLLIECHAESDNRQYYHRRLKHDLNTSHYQTGLLIFFDRASCSGTVTRVMSGQSLH